MNIDEARAAGNGAWVVYDPGHGQPKEDGTITQVGDQYVHVLYKGDRTAKATHPSDLKLGCPPAYQVREVHLWVDDKVKPPYTDDGPHWMWAHNVDEATRTLSAAPVTHLSLDYSLASVGDWDENGGAVLEWLRDHPTSWMILREIRLHSRSSSGRQLMERMANEFKPEGWTGEIIDTCGL